MTSQPRSKAPSRKHRATQVEPALGWTYLSRDSLAHAKAQMDEETKGVRDELGFLTLHQRYADRFFPGTSVLHTRARYAIFVPWHFEDLAGRVGATAERALRERERDLAGRLKAARQAQVIGRRVHPKPSSQPPSMVYWSALATWGILRPRLDGRTISRAQAFRLLKDARTTTDDDGQPLTGIDPPFIPLPARPADWEHGPITLQMTKAEAAFLRERLSHLRGSERSELSLLAKLVRTEKPSPPGMWSDAVYAIAGSDREPLTRAQDCASLGCVGRAIYDALIEHLVEEETKGMASTRHREHLPEVVAEHRRAATGVNIDAVEADIGPLPFQLRHVMSATKEWLGSTGSDVRDLLAAYTAAEARKGPRARLAQTPNGRTRRLEWTSDEHVLAGPLHYRWAQVRTLLNDLANAE